MARDEARAAGAGTEEFSENFGQTHSLTSPRSSSHQVMASGLSMVIKGPSAAILNMMGIGGWGLGFRVGFWFRVGLG